ncbi:MAG: hypothetical protein ACJ75Z_11530 [Solirubrobacterales bacterium]
MKASDQQVTRGEPHKVQLHAAYEGTIAESAAGRSPTGAERLYLMVTTVFDRLTMPDDDSSGAAA